MPAQPMKSLLLCPLMVCLLAGCATGGKPSAPDAGLPAALADDNLGHRADPEDAGPGQDVSYPGLDESAETDSDRPAQGLDRRETQTERFSSNLLWLDGYDRAHRRHGNHKPKTHVEQRPDGALPPTPRQPSIIDDTSARDRPGPSSQPVDGVAPGSRGPDQSGMSSGVLNGSGINGKPL